MSGYRDLAAWHKSVDLVCEIYRITACFPKEELYGLVSQLRRAAVSIPSNIAEGYGRNSRNELHHFIGQARGSLLELETQVEIAGRLGYVDVGAGAALLRRTDEIGRILAGLRTWSENR